MFTLNLVRYLSKLDLLFFWGAGRWWRAEEEGCSAQAPPRGGGTAVQLTTRYRPSAPQRGGGTAVQLTTRYRPSAPKGWRHRSSAHNQVQTKRISTFFYNTVFIIIFVKKKFS